MFTSGSWAERSQDVHFADFKFLITHHFLKDEADGGAEPSEEGGWSLAGGECERSGVGGVTVFCVQTSPRPCRTCCA